MALRAFPFHIIVNDDFALVATALAVVRLSIKFSVLNIVIDETKDGDSTILTIHAHAEDIGKIIGKSGRIIKALRDIIKLMATKEQTYVDVVIAEPEKPIAE